MPRLPAALLILACAAALAWAGAPATSGRSGGEAAAAEVARLRYLASIYQDDKGGGMREPEAVACNDKATLVVGDTGRGRLLRYTVEDRNVKAAGEIVAPQLAAPIRVQITSKDELLALDGKQRRILRFGAKGEFKDYVSPEGVPAPAGIVPRSLRLDRTDNIYVLDVFSARVLVLDPGGKYLRHVPFPKDAGFFSDLAVDGREAIYLLDSLKAAVYVAQKDAKEFSPLAKDLREHVSFPTSVAVDSRGILFLVDQHGGGIVLLSQDGSVLGRQLAMGRNEGALYYPAQICLTEKGQLFVADRGNSRVQLFSVVR